ncbi:protein FAR-RED IMPAIRED RESPONSE 1-like [Bidens hawaiensis]|uniref:protein FAR-RED IMPAIRED RESPONSE 1-like n=1 Tax=Bidens hawaiensis TaxID=980011 RepID=UPI00404AA945
MIYQTFLGNLLPPKLQLLTSGYIIYCGSHPLWSEDNRTSPNTYDARVEEPYGQSSQQLHVDGPYYGTQNSYQLPLGEQPYMSRPVPSNYFNYVAELVDWVKKTGREHGCVISVQLSRNKSVELICNRGGEPKLKARVRHTGSITRGCPFKLVARYNAPGVCWKLEVVNETHNHNPVLFEEGHPALRKLTEEEIDMVATLHRQGLRPTKIKSAIKQRFPGNKCITRDIYNVVKLVDDQDKIGDTPIQVLENFLQTHGFTFYTWEKPSTNRTENVFFYQEKSHTMWRAFLDLFLIDTMHNTNMYKWPFVLFVGVTSTSKSICIAYAVIFREQECNCTWALERLKDMLVDCRKPRVILTDKNQALMKSCETVFPNATKNLCRWHIFQNIKKKHKSLFQTDIFESFSYWWKVLYESPTKSIFEFNCG